MCSVYVSGLTGEDGAELGPAGDPSLRGVLAQRNLQEEHGQATTKQEDEVRDEKRAWKMGYGESITYNLLATTVTKQFGYSSCLFPLPTSTIFITKVREPPDVS